METRFRSVYLAVLLIGAVALMSPLSAMAAGTLAGTTITNNATVTYSVNGQAQPTPPAATAAFMVDDKVIFTVTAMDSSAITAQPGGKFAQPFKVTNNGNNTHDFALVATQITGTLSPAPTYVVADNANGTDTNLKTSGSGTVYIDEMAPDASMTVYVVITAPNQAPNGAVVNYSLAAIAYQGGTPGSLGALSTNTAGVKNSNLNTMYTVLADAAGNGAGDKNGDGQYIQNGQFGFVFASAVVSVTKTSAIYSDPINNTTNPRAIPQAMVIYTLTVTNSGSASTSALTITDALPGTIQLVNYSDGVAPSPCTAGQVEIKQGSGAFACTGAPNVSMSAWSASTGQTLTISNLNLDTAGVTNPIIIRYMAQIQ